MFTLDTDLYKLQRDSPDLAMIIAYVQDGTLPTDAKAAETLKTDAVNWYIDKDGILYHIHDKPGGPTIKATSDHGTTAYVA